MASLKNFRVSFGFDCSGLATEAHRIEQLPLFRKCMQDEVENKLGQPAPSGWSDIDVGPNGHALRFDPVTGIVEGAEMLAFLRALVKQADVSSTWSVSIEDKASLSGCWYDPSTLVWQPLLMYGATISSEPWLALATTQLFEARYSGSLSTIARTQLSAMQLRLVAHWSVYAD